MPYVSSLPHLSDMLFERIANPHQQFALHHSSNAEQEASLNSHDQHVLDCEQSRDPSWSRYPLYLCTTEKIHLSRLWITMLSRQQHRRDMPKMGGNMKYKPQTNTKIDY
jgi:hypothetical protein